MGQQHAEGSKMKDKQYTLQACVWEGEAAGAAEDQRRKCFRGDLLRPDDLYCGYSRRKWPCDCPKFSAEPKKAGFKCNRRSMTLHESGAIA